MFISDIPPWRAMAARSISLFVENSIGSIYFLVFLAFVAIFDATKGSFVNSLSQLTQIMVDSGIHSWTALVIWYLVASIMVKDMREDIGMTRREEAAVVYLMSAAVDADHFLSAGSLSLHDATNLHSRMWLVFHNPFTVLLLCVVAHWYGRRPRLAAIIAISMGSHLLRDATRTGLLLYPMGASAPVPYFIFIVVLCVSPYVVARYLRRSFQDKRIPQSLQLEGEKI